MPHNKVDVFCVNVIDGDTIEVRWRNRRRKVRILGIDTPETHNHAKRLKQSRTFHLDDNKLLKIGKHASRISRQELDQTRVALSFPDKMGDTDDYGRLLCYVDTQDGRDIGAELVARGCAFPRREYHPRRSRYITLLKEAKKDKLGFFS